MRTLRIFACLVVSVAALTIPGASPASAEIDPTNRTWWGVAGTASDTTTDNIAADVWAIEQIGSVVYVGGKFTQIAHESRRYDQQFIAAFDAATGVWISTWTPQFDGPVYALQASADGSRLFVGGEFESVDGANVKGLVALVPATGQVDWSWRTRVSGGSPAVVRAFDLEGDQLYIGGSFDAIGANGARVNASGAGRVSASSGAIDSSWLPALAGGGVWDIAASKVNARVFIVGSFTSVAGAANTKNVVRVNNAGNVSGTWRYTLNHDYPEFTHAVETTPQGMVFIGGSQHILNAYSESDMVLRWSHFTNPRGGDFQAAEYDPVTQRVYASCHCYNQHFSRNDGGQNTSMRGQGYTTVGTRTNIDWVIAYDASTGAKVESFAPDFSGVAGPWALHVAPNGCLWVGGGITATNGKRQHSMTKICDPAILDSIRPSTPNGLVASAPTASSIDLRWNPSTDNVGVVRYEIYNNATGEVMATSSTPSLTIQGLAAGSFVVYVKATDADGNRSWRSGFARFTLSGDDVVRPSTPRALNVDGRTNQSVALVWLASTDNVGVVGYEVINVATKQVVATSTSTSATVPAAPGVEYAVRAYDAAGNRSWRSNTQAG